MKNAQLQKTLNGILWWAAGFAVGTGILVLATMVELGRLDDIATGIIWFTLGAPFVILMAAHVVYVLVRWIALPVSARRLPNLAWSDQWSLAARDLVMIASTAGWLIAALLTR